jgi:2-desacetyl-2-hydroxyethyl bacteriochlorophyllide A dehydrogenase
VHAYDGDGTSKQEGGSMLAGCYVGDRTIVVEEREPRPPGEGEVEIAVAFTGICGTDLHVLHGAMDQRVTLPAVLGHEMSGTVASVGAGVQGWSAGDHVVVMPLHWCGECPACRAGNSHICQRLDFIGIDSPGSMQGRWTVPEWALVRLPEELPLRIAALTEPTAVAVHDVRRAALAAGELALVVGGGPIGMLIASVARTVGAEVVVLEPSAERREIGERIGLRVLDPGSTDLATFVEDWTAGAGVAVAFEVSGAPAGLDAAISSLAVRGRLGLVAIHPNPVPVNLHRFFLRELSLIGSRVYERSDFEEAVRLLSAGAIPAAELTTEVLPLAEVARAFERLEAGSAMKLLLDCSSGR